jgi:hypothetical protein
LAVVAGAAWTVYTYSNSAAEGTKAAKPDCKVQPQGSAVACGDLNSGNITINGPNEKQ